jgi:hypothetical protein
MRYLTDAPAIVTEDVLREKSAVVAYLTSKKTHAIAPVIEYLVRSRAATTPSLSVAQPYLIEATTEAKCGTMLNRAQESTTMMMHDRSMESDTYDSPSVQDHYNRSRQFRIVLRLIRALEASERLTWHLLKRPQRPLELPPMTNVDNNTSRMCHRCMTDRTTLKEVREALEDLQSTRERETIAWLAEKESWMRRIAFDATKAGENTSYEAHPTMTADPSSNGTSNDHDESHHTRRQTQGTAIAAVPVDITMIDESQAQVASLTAQLNECREKERAFAALHVRTPHVKTRYVHVDIYIFAVSRMPMHIM